MMTTTAAKLHTMRRWYYYLCYLTKVPRDDPPHYDEAFTVGGRSPMEKTVKTLRPGTFELYSSLDFTSFDW